MKQITLVHRYFWPDSPPYAHMLRSIAEQLAEDGFRVCVLTAQPSYGATADHHRAPRRETVNGVEIHRLRLLPERKDQLARRIINLVAFAVQASVAILHSERPDAVMAATTPPVLVSSLTSLAARARGAAFVYHNQDIYPEVLGAARTGGHAVARRVLRWLDTRTGSRADRVVVLSTDMAKTWQRRGAPDSKLATINNFHDATVADAAHASARDCPDEVDAPAPGVRRLVFAGNVGRFQDVPALVEAVARLHDDRLELIIVGDGAELQRCQARASVHCRFIGRTSAEVAQQWIESADACVVSLRAGLIPFVYPSKTFAYLAAGAPLFVCVEEESELAQLVTQEGLGWTVAPGTDPLHAQRLDSMLRDFAGTDDATLDAMRQRALRVGHRQDRSTVLARWSLLFSDVCS